MKEREAPENVETGLVTALGSFKHTLQYGQMRCHFRPWRDLSDRLLVILGELDEKP